MIFSATVPQYIQDIARNKMESPLLLDLVGTDTNQVPDTIKNNIVLVSDNNQKDSQLAKFITSNRDKKIMIFTETKKEAKDFEYKNYCHFLPLHGALS